MSMKEYKKLWKKEKMLVPKFFQICTVSFSLKLYSENALNLDRGLTFFSSGKGLPVRKCVWNETKKTRCVCETQMPTKRPFFEKCHLYM